MIVWVTTLDNWCFVLVGCLTIILDKWVIAAVGSFISRRFLNAFGSPLRNFQAVRLKWYSFQLHSFCFCVSIMYFFSVGESFDLGICFQPNGLYATLLPGACVKYQCRLLLYTSCSCVMVSVRFSCTCIISVCCVPIIIIISALALLSCNARARSYHRIYNVFKPSD
jgi:hypothetical protein